MLNEFCLNCYGTLKHGHWIKLFQKFKSLLNPGTTNVLKRTREMKEKVLFFFFLIVFDVFGFGIFQLGF